MLSNDLYLLAITAASIGFIHTVIGPDHYLPFIVISKARSWSIKKTMLVTALCGIAHILSSVLLGIIGISMGLLLSKLKFIESFRGNIAAWALITFGLIYTVWALQKLYKNRVHQHAHVHQDGSTHTHEHGHHHAHSHIHIDEKNQFSITPWVLFIIFVLGPCEPLIPILMYPAAKNSMFGMILITSVFGITTILTMTSIVLASTFGLTFVSLGRLEKYSNVLAGLLIFSSGLAIQYFGL